MISNDLTISGWGQTETNSEPDNLSDYLLEGVQKVVKNDGISKGKPVNRFTILRGTQSNGVDPCLGDSGGKT